MFLFSEKTKSSNSIILNTYYTNFIKGLKLRNVDKTQLFENEESCRSIKEHFGKGSFSFKPVSKNDIISAIKNYH